MSGVQEPKNEFGGNLNNNATLMLDPQNSATTNLKLNIPILFGNVPQLSQTRAHHRAYAV